ncbi:MAG: DUF5694 domain-containing protein [Chloroflexota bacterium]
MTNQIPIMLLGTYHFANPGLDEFNPQTDDVLSEKRQAELVTLTDALAQFQPTKIALEVPLEMQDTINQRYEKYRAEDSKSDTRGEHVQIGFRLAHKLGLSTIHAIDVHGDVDFQSVVTYAVEHQQATFASKLQEIGQGMMAEFAERQKTSTISEMLHFFNEEDTLQKAQTIYMDALRVGKHPDFIGAEMVSAWYTRNFKIFSSLMAITTPNDRVLVIFGQGHIPILRQCLNDSTFATYQSPLNYI